jgi:hypothetical protein
MEIFLSYWLSQHADLVDNGSVRMSRQIAEKDQEQGRGVAIAARIVSLARGKDKLFFVGGWARLSCAHWSRSV